LEKRIVVGEKKEPREKRKRTNEWGRKEKIYPCRCWGIDLGKTRRGKTLYGAIINRKTISLGRGGGKSLGEEINRG